MTTFKILLLMVAVAALTLNFPAISAQSIPPHVFVGTATVNGLAAPMGTSITAFIGGVEAGSSAVSDSNGDYGIPVWAGNSTIISFKIGGLEADQIALWEQGGGTELDLTASSIATPPHIFIGSASVKDVPAPTGTIVTALIGGELRGAVEVGPNGSYGALVVKQGSSTTISFKIGNFIADQTATWEQGGANVLNLTAALTTFDCSVVNSTPAQECEVLVALFDSTGGPNWTNNTGWLDSTTPCSWYGITCSSGRVATIYLDSNQLSGSIPPEQGNLAGLKVLDLSDNQLTGNIPPELGNLISLANLNLYGNQLSGSIPPELGNLASLKLLDLDSNQLTGTIPPDLGNLASLQILYLHFNGLTGAIPPELGNLASLQNLYLSGNQLTGAIPPELANLANLQSLVLGSNQLTGTIPPELANLVNLQWLDLIGNQVTGSIPIELSNLANLYYLGLDGNQLTGTIPIELSNLANLKGLFLSGNQLTGTIPIELSNLANLLYLRLGNNQLRGTIPMELANLANLQYLGLSVNQLTGSIPIDLANLVNLGYLDLSGNQLNGSIPLNLTRLSLSEFYFDNTNLCEPTNPGFQAWLATISNLRSTGVRCTSVEFVWPIAPDDRESDGDGNGVSGDYANYGDVVSDKHHVGLDTLTGPEATVLAASDGHVFMIQENGGNLNPNIPCHEPLLPNESSYCEDHGYGNTVIIEHRVPADIDPGGKIYTHYSHLKSIGPDLISGCRDEADPNREKRRTCDSVIAVVAGEPIGQVGSTCYGVDCTVRHLHFEIKTFPTLAAISNECCDFGYTTQHPDDLGYFDPLIFLHDISQIPPNTISAGNRVGITNSRQGVGLRMGPGIYTLLGSVNAGQQFVARRTGPATADPSCSMGWYQVFKTENPISPPSPDDYFSDITGGKTPDAWICRGNAGEAWVGAATQTGINVQVAPTQGVSVAFQQIAGQGITSVNLSISNPGAVSGIQFLGTFYDVITTADYTGTVTVCLDYDASGMAQSAEENLRVFHWDGLSWLDVTASLDTGNDNICATVPSLSWFAIGEAQPIGNLGEPSFDPYQDPTDGATGFKVDITRVFDSSTNEDVNVDLESFQAGLTYPDVSANPALPPGTLCVNILDVREMDFSVNDLNIEDVLAGTTFIGVDPAGVPWPADLGHALTRLNGSAKQQCRVDLEMTSVTDTDDHPVTVPPLSTQLVQRGDARADGNVTIDDALFIAEYLVGSSDACTTVVTTTCLHSVNAASVRQDGAFDEITIADSLVIAQHLVGLRDENYNFIPSLDSGKIVFRSLRGGKQSHDIYVMNGDGTVQTRLTDNAGDDYFPDWSPDGSKIAFHTYRGGNPDIYVMNADGTNETRLTDNLSQDGWANWSPDGTKIAFTSNRDGDFEIYVMNSDGTGQTRLTSNPGVDGDVSWSPDGAKIAFYAERDGNPDVYVMNADGTGQIRLTNALGWDSSPSWSPDGTKIAFGSDRDGNWNIYIMNTDGTSQARLTNDPAVDNEPAWSPDGTKIAFRSMRDGDSEIFAMNADGSNQTRLTNSVGIDAEPSWGATSPGGR